MNLLKIVVSDFSSLFYHQMDLILGAIDFYGKNKRASTLKKTFSGWASNSDVKLWGLTSPHIFEIYFQKVSKSYPTIDNIRMRSSHTR